MKMFNFRDSEALGRVTLVDTTTVVVSVSDMEQLRRFHINQLAVMHSRKPGQYLIGLVIKIARKSQYNSRTTENYFENNYILNNKSNLVVMRLIGTFYCHIDDEINTFKKTLETVPDIDSFCFPLEGMRLAEFMKTISRVDNEKLGIDLGRFVLYDSTVAYLDGSKFFQRHAMIVGSTGSGKSWTVARLLEQVSDLPQANAILFDIHGEYQELTGKGFRNIKIAGPNDLGSTKSLGKNILHLPYWLLEYKDLAKILGINIRTASVLERILREEIVSEKIKTVRSKGREDMVKRVTVSSPIPFKIKNVRDSLKRKIRVLEKNKKRTRSQEDRYDRLVNLVAIIQSRIDDLRLAFLFHAPIKCYEWDWLAKMNREISAGSNTQTKNRGGIKIIDFSNIPSEIVPLVIKSIVHVVFNASIRTDERKRHPIAIICDEADLYIRSQTRRPGDSGTTSDIFERVAKEGRKHGIGLVVVCQSPSRVNNTVLSQCNNIIAMRLPNHRDREIVRSFLPENLTDLNDLIPALDVGEALVVGDSIMLPAHLKISKPNKPPRSDTLDFIKMWSKENLEFGGDEAIESWRLQGLTGYPDSDFE